MKPVAIFWLAYLAVLVLGATYAFGHNAHHVQQFTSEEVAWMERQYSVDEMKCCDPTDIYLGERVNWRMNNRHYEVNINGTWHVVPPGRLMNNLPDDPSPFGEEAIVFYSVYPSGVNIWCFRPPPLF